MPKKLLFFLGIAMLIVAFYFGWLKFHDVFSGEQPQDTETTAVESGADVIIPNTEDTADTIFDKDQYSPDKPGSLWWVVNRQRPLPSGYAPSDLKVPSVSLRGSSGAENMNVSATIETDMVAMFAAAKQKGYNLVLGSGYRSQATQTKLYNNYVSQYGAQEADRFSARPGTSEHQTGLSFDVTTANGTCFLEVCFGDTPEGKWIKNNAHLYGFIVRYQQGKENITGYQYEPWHLRYVGRDLATQLFNKNQAMEEFFNLPNVPLP